MKRICLLGLLMVAVLSLAACGGSANGLSEMTASKGSMVDQPLGVAGVDYDPSVLVVNYTKNARVPSKLASMAPPAGKRASDQPFETVRKYAQYEKLTDAAAVCAGVEIERQAYIDGLRMAAFKVPDGADPEAARQAILDNLGSAVESVEYARLVYATYTPNDPDFTSSNILSGSQWGQKKVGCEEAWDKTKGIASVRVAVCDTGVRITHEELLGSVLDPQEAFPNENLDVVNVDNTVEDNDGHGTFISGIIGAKQDNNRTITGIAPDCEIIPIKISNDGATSDYIMAMGVSLAVELGARVINLSWGGDQGSTTMENMVNSAYNNGVLLVTAAGNDGVSTAAYPALYEHGLCVGATSALDQRSTFSNYGDYVDIAAPGEWLKSCLSRSDSSYEPYGAGTSYAAPFVAAAAALLWSYSPQLTMQEVWDRLVDTTVPAQGFSTSNPVGRLDLAAAMGTIEELSISAPRLDRLVYSGVVYLEPLVTGQPDAVEMYVNDQLIDSKTVEPYIFGFDSSAVEFGIATVDFATVRGNQRTFVTIDLLVDNTAGEFPLNEGFENPEDKSFVGIDLKNFDVDFLASIKNISEEFWSPEDLAAAGAGLWMPCLSNAAAGNRCEYFGQATNTYDAYELNALVSKKVELAADTTPVLSFHHHFNIEDGGEGADRGYVYVTSDGLNLAPARTATGAPVYFSGYEPDWTQVELDLSRYAGTTVNIVLLFEGDADVAGEMQGVPAGWWVDAISTYNAINDGLPHVMDQPIDAGTMIGLVPGLITLELGLYSTQNVATASYTLDMAPVGVSGDNDIHSGEITASFFRYSLAVPTNVANQDVELIIEFADAQGVDGEPIVIPLTIYNKRGDFNGDGQLTEDDLAGLVGSIGIREGETGYDPLLDADGDGEITEADAAAIAYFWEE